MTRYNEDTDDLDPFEADRAEIKRDYREWAKQAAQTPPPDAKYVCGNCNRRTTHIARKRCRTCSAYLSRYGVERPPELFGKHRSRVRIA